jgi:hypothetical protein
MFRILARSIWRLVEECHRHYVPDLFSGYGIAKRKTNHTDTKSIKIAKVDGEPHLTFSYSKKRD